MCIIFLTIGMVQIVCAQKAPMKENSADSAIILKKYQKRPPPHPFKKKNIQPDETDAAAPIKRERRLPPHHSIKKSAERNEKLKSNNDKETKTSPVRSDRAVNATKKIETKYLRPSITTLFLQSKNADEKVVINKFKNLTPDSRFDMHAIQFNDLKSISEIEDYVQAVSNPIIAKWWGRDQQGNFNYSLIANRGAYSATDADIITSRGSNTNRIEMIGEQLINKSYIVVYKIDDLYDMEEHYNLEDYKNRNNVDFKPVKRTDEGYKCKYTTYVYKIDFNDSVAQEFYSRYWVDKKNQDNSKVTAWVDAKFPVAMVTSITNTVSSAQSKTPLPYIKKKTMLELLEGIPGAIQENAFATLNNRIEDFKLKTTVFDAYPVLAKLGNKEGLYTDQRFIIYEIEQSADGNQIINRKGVVRVKKISDNKSVATGESNPSQFYQVSGKHLYPGMFMKSKEDAGLVFSGGYKYSNNLALGGGNVSLDLNISRLLNITGIYLGIEGSLASMGKVSVISSAGNLSGGTAYSYGLSLSKETYFLNRGNFYIRPLIGGGIQEYNFKKLDGSDIQKEDKKSYTWRSYFGHGAIGLGINISPLLSLEIRPGGYYRLKAITKNSEYRTLPAIYSSTSDWGFESLNKGNGGYTVSANLRIRL